jgi:hypothetical protein
VAYDNHIYIAGGLTTVSTLLTSDTVQYASVQPDGRLTSFTSTGLQSLTTARYGLSLQAYNHVLYVVGGDSTFAGTPVTTVEYAVLNKDGTMNAWVTTSSLTGSGRMALGGIETAIWGGYLYISGGCMTVNGSGRCTAVATDVQLASINADGSLDSWNAVLNLTNDRFGGTLIAWQNGLYRLGGCRAQDPSSGDCTDTIFDVDYGVINQDGDASTVNQSVPSGSGSCTGTNPTNCDLPPVTYIGQVLNATAILNGYIYVIGGCTTNACTSMSTNVVYAAIASDGSLSKPATCSSGVYSGAWCVDSTNTISGGVGAASTAIFNNTIYVVGGLTGSGNKNTIYRTTVNDDGTINTWTSQSLTGVGATSVSYEYAYSRANPASGTNPGNLFIFGGCSTSSAAGCTAYSQAVYKCDIQAAGAVAACTTSGQQQIGIVPGDSVVGLGIMSGTVYANYVYLIGGVSPNQTDLQTLRYAKIDNNNNIVSANGSGNWAESPNLMHVGRRRAAAFGYNGYIYIVGGYDGTGGGGILADIEFIKVNVSDGSLGSVTDGFHISSVEIGARWGLAVQVSNSFAYVIGGCNNGNSPTCNSGGLVPTIQTFQVYNNDSGSPAGYADAAHVYATSPDRVGMSSAVLGGYIYVAGGCTSATDCTAATTNVSYAPIDANGTVGTWSNTTAALPAARTWGRLVVAGGSLYYIGGQSSTATDERAEIYYATPSSGDITTWSTATNGLPQQRTKFAATVWNNRIYVVAGLDASAAPTATVYVSPQLNSGGNISSSWTTGTALSVARYGTMATAYANNLYVFGGNDGSNYLSDSQYSQIDTASGLSGSWTYTTSLPSPVMLGRTYAANGYIYVIGGRTSAASCRPRTLVAPISANTTIASGNHPTGIGEWYETNQRYDDSRYGAAVAYSNGKTYILGGACGGTLTYATHTIQQTALLAQPQVAEYSIMIDTDKDVFPQKWLLNGLDNSIGSAWQLSYQSRTDNSTSCTIPPMTTWGQRTDVGNVSLGTPGVYTPLDGAGVNTNCARYYNLMISIDSSQTFGYPDDISRGPTIDDLTLLYTATPSKRLIHGKTFTGGVAQPLDTPF